MNFKKATRNQFKKIMRDLDYESFKYEWGSLEVE